MTEPITIQGGAHFADEPEPSRALPVGYFLKWLNDPSRGQTFLYWRGDLATDRQGDAGLDLLAAEIDSRGPMDRIEMSACYHQRHVIEGTGEVTLFTVRHGVGDTSYYAKRVEAAH